MLPLDFHPRKRLGQNFLIDKNIIIKMLKIASFSKQDMVLEIGPGQGILTKELASLAKKVIAVELDKKLYDYLKIQFKNIKNIDVVNCDILKFDIEKYVKKNKIKSKIKLIGNIPYSITTPILEYVFKNLEFFSDIYLTVQREFALRLVAKPNTGDYSSISCFAQFHTNPTLLFPIKRTCFRPTPKVDSYFIRLEPRRLEQLPKEFQPKNKELLFRLIRAAFGQRRKSILNSLSSVLEKKNIFKILSSLNIDYKLRAENLSLQDYVRISNSI